MQTSKNSSRPSDVNFLYSLFSHTNIGGIQTRENKSRKLYINKYKNGNNAQFFG